MQPGLRQHVIRALPWIWLTLSAAWLVVILTTELPAWTLAIWIATTLGPLAALQSRLKAANEPAADV